MTMNMQRKGARTAGSGLRTCGAVILTVTLACAVGMAQAEGLTLGGKKGLSVGVNLNGGVSANVGVGGKNGVNADVNLGGATGMRSNTGTGVPAVLSPVVPQVAAPGTPIRKANKPLAIAGPNSLVGVDTNVLGLDVVADVLEYNGNILDLCIGSCRDGNGGGGGGGTDPGDGGGGGGGGGGGIVVINPGPGEPPATGTLVSSTVAVATTEPVGKCGDEVNATEVALNALQTNASTDPSLVRTTFDLNLPIRGVELKCSAGGNAQVFNGFSVLDMNGKKIGILHDAFLTADLTIRRIQFQGLDQRCFGLSEGKYSVKGAALTVDVPASFVYQ